MRLKPVPEPPAALADLEAFRRAVPLVPGREDDCCTRLRERLDLPDRRVANDWLAFLRALGLVEETSRGFRRTDADLTAGRVREGLRERVLFAPEAATLLADASPSNPVTPADLFEATRGSVPRHDRARDPEWEATWLDRADRLLRWFVLVDLAARVGGDADGNGDAAYVAGDAA